MGRWRELLPSNLLEVSASRLPHKVVARHGARSLTYAELEQRSNQLARALLAAGVEKSEPVAILLPNCLEYTEAYYGINRAGAAYLPMLTRLTPDEIAYQLSDSGATAVVTDAAYATMLAEHGIELPKLPRNRWLVIGDERPVGTVDYADAVFGQSVDPPDVSVVDTDIASIRYTSGTTGRPKGSVNVHRNWYVVQLNMVASWQVTQDDVTLGNGPFSHVAGTMGMVHVAAGGSFVVHDKFDAATTVRAIASQGVTDIFMVPTQYTMVLDRLVDEPVDTSSLRLLISAAAPMTKDLKRRVLAAFPGAALHEFYSATETPMITELMPGEQMDKLGSVGQVRYGCAVRILDDDLREMSQGDVGQIWVSGPSLHTGYHNRPDANAESIHGDWMTVGDMGYLDQDGFLFLVDRRKDLIITGGLNVYPTEVEEVLVQHPGVNEVAVYGVPEPTWGEQVCAACVPSPGAEPDQQELITWARRRLADYKTPRVVHFVDELPRSSTGKVLRRELRRISEAAGG